MYLRLSLLLIGILALPVRAQPTISGRIVDLDKGVPLPDVRVALCAPDGVRLNPPHVTWTDADGRYRLGNIPPGAWCVDVLHAEQDVGYVLTTAPFTLGDAPFVLNLRLPTALRERLRNASAPMDPNPKSLTTITGYLEEGYATDARGHVFAGSRTSLAPFETGLLRGRVTHDDGPATDALVVMPDAHRQTRTDAEGRFELDHLPPGPHRLYIVHRADTLAIPPLAIQKGLNLVNFSVRKDTQ